jgi:hypothetical protein
MEDRVSVLEDKIDVIEKTDKEKQMNYKQNMKELCDSFKRPNLPGFSGSYL